MSILRGAKSEAAISTLVSADLLSFDVEFGNSRGFFSGSGQRPDIYGRGRLPEEVKFAAEIEQGSSAAIVCFDSTIVSDVEARRSVQFKFSRQSHIFDVVSRYVVIDTSSGRPSKINGQNVEHKSSNTYHQYPADVVKVPIGETAWLEFKGEVEGIPEGLFEHVFYIRDESVDSSGHRWIVHHRAIATELAEQLILRCCNPRFEGPVPSWVNRIIPKLMLRWLFRIRETTFPNFPLMVVGECCFAEGEKITLSSSIRYHE